ncbi:unnamed protein product [Paramecium primaurelia]|uniref:Uncharacterized protein n=1 Tax=Paramecium primaurelia TaxID=5886 RepID=A0A8S1JUN0_PARPR|nr:unnamed protein product [Paramecium primaurelia]
MSRQNSQERFLKSANSCRNQGRQLNIIDFIMKQNFQDQGPQTIEFQEEMNVQKSCEMCLQLQEELKKFVNVDKFQQVIEKMWQKIKKIEEDNQKVLLKIENLEKVLIDQQGFLDELNDQQYKSQQQQDQSSILQQVTLDKGQLEKLEKKIQKDNLAGIKSIEDNLYKILNKEIQQKFMVMQEKLEEISQQFGGVNEQIELFNHKHGVTKEECEERINQIALIVNENNQFLRSNNHGVAEMQQHYSDLDADMMRIFQHIKALLQNDYKITEMEQNITNLKSQLVQLRNAVNEIAQLLRLTLKKSAIHRQSQQINPLPSIQNKPKKMKLETRQQSETSIAPKKQEKKIQRQMSNVDKGNFLYFLYAQKNGQKNEKQFAEFLRKTYNFEPPQKNEGPSKKGLLYLSKREENEDHIKKLTNSVLSPGNKSIIGNKEVPLDQVVSQMFEKQLERFPKVKQKIERTQ